MWFSLSLQNPYFWFAGLLWPRGWDVWKNVGFFGYHGAQGGKHVSSSHASVDWQCAPPVDYRLQNGSSLQQILQRRGFHWKRWGQQHSRSHCYRECIIFAQLPCHRSSERALVQHKQHKFHQALQGPYTAELALAMTSINYLKGTNWWEKIIAAARCIIWMRSWTESEQVRLLCFGGDGYQSHEFHAFDMEGLGSVLTTVHWLSGLVHLQTELLLMCCVMQVETLGGLKTSSGLHKTRGRFWEMELARIHIGSSRRWAQGTVETSRQEHPNAEADRRVTIYKWFKCEGGIPTTGPSEALDHSE